MSRTSIVGVGMTPLGKHLDTPVRALTAAAVTSALEDAGIGREAIEAAWFCNTRQGALEGQHGVRGQASLRAYGFEGIPIFNTDNACASSSSGVFQAFAAVEAGLFETVLVVGAEKMNYPEKREAMFEAFKGSWDRELADRHLADLLAIGDRMETEGRTWPQLVDDLLSTFVEPELIQPTIVTDYPVELSPFAKQHRSKDGLVERWEAFVGGIEIANAFTELNDPDEQRRRFEAEMDVKQATYGERYPLDEDFLAALALMPQASGVALGFDRLVMLAAGATRVDQVMWAPVA